MSEFVQQPKFLSVCNFRTSTAVLIVPMAAATTVVLQRAGVGESTHRYGFSEAPSDLAIADDFVQSAMSALRSCTANDLFIPSSDCHAEIP